MGDRALVQFIDSKKQVSPVVYLHWQGSMVEDYLYELARLMKDRKDDVQYSCARFIGIVHSHNVDSHSLGVWNQSKKLTAKDSHGDAGVFVVNCENWQVKASGGYGKSFNASPV